MELIGKVYRLWDEPLDMKARENFNFTQIQYLKRVISGTDDFRWTTSSEHSKLKIHNGGDILSDDKYLIAEIENNKATIYGESSGLEKFLDEFYSD